MGRYQLGDILGSGAMGDVRAAWDLRLHRPVAVKVLRPEVASAPGVRARFEHEARIAARLVHPHVVTVFDTGDEGANAFLVMEQLSGRTLADDVADGPLPTETVRSIGLQVLEALTAAHQIGLVHRDIKPSNLLVAAPLTWKVGDFGIAKSVEATDPGLTSTGLVIGTPAYLAPERLAGAAAGPSADLYALGLVLHEAVTGSRAWRPHQMALPVVPPLEDLGITWAPSLSAVIQRAVDPDQARRFSSAAEMAAQLRSDEAVPAATVAFAGSGTDAGPVSTAVLDGEAMAPSLAVGEELRASRRRRRIMLAVAATALAILAAVLITGTLTTGGGPSPSTPSTLAPATSTVLPPTTAGPSPAGSTPAVPATPGATTTSDAPAPTTAPTTVPPATSTKPGHGHDHGGSSSKGD
ncbi:MAG: serine/threonine protein kinase [Actinomycetota bacterium]|nr:serine/threonine protein kinase [Actinomycetota bacterium]